MSVGRQNQQLFMSIYYNHNENLTHQNRSDRNQEWENIEHVPSHSIQDQQNLKKNQKEQIHGNNHKIDKLIIEQKQQVASRSSSEPNENEDELECSTSTVQSNNRRKYRSFQRDSNEWPPNIIKKDKKKVKEQQLVLKQKNKKVEKTQPKYLFYHIVKEQKGPIPNKQQQDIVNNQQSKQVNKNKRPSRQPNIIKDYKYQKDVHPQKQHKKERLKNKIGFIFDLFHRNQEVASVSYYSESHKQSVQSIHQLKKQQESSKKNENIFNQHPQNSQQKHIDAESNQKQLLNSNQFQVINLPTKQFTRSNKQGELGIHSKIQKQGIINKSSLREELERSMLNKSKINTSKEKSKISLAKSLQNKPKKTRYDDLGEVEQVNQGNKSIDISRHLSSNKASFKRESQKKQSLSKSISLDSKVSIKMVQVKKRHSQDENEADKPQYKRQRQQVVHYQSKKQNKEQDMEYEQTTVKKTFPIAKNIMISKNNLFSNYMKINYKQSDGSKQDAVDQQIPNLFIKNTNHNMSNMRTRPIDAKTNDLKQIQTNSNTGEISIKPLNKIQFTIDKSKRIKPQLIQPKDNLTEQQRKFLNLLKKREEALLKRVKQQVSNNNPNSILKDNQQRLNSNDFDRLMSQQDSSLKLKAQKSYKTAQRRDKMSLKTQPQVQIKQFPTLNSIPYSKQAKFDTFYNNSPIKRTSSKNLNYLSSKGKKGLSEHLSNDSQRKTQEDRMDQIKGFKRQSSKISYYNAKKLHNDFSLKDRLNLNSKEKYDRLKQLLHQI